MHRTVVPLALLAAACVPAPAASDVPTVEAAAPVVVDAPKPRDQASPSDRCIEDVVAHALPIIIAEHGDTIADFRGRPVTAAHIADIEKLLWVNPLPDIDDDGVEDVEVTMGYVWGSYGALHLIYTSNSGCRRYVGDLIAAAELNVLKARNGALADLEGTWSNGCAGHDFVWTRYQFDGTRYAVVDEAECALCPDASIAAAPGPHANRHPQCAR